MGVVPDNKQVHMVVGPLQSSLGNVYNGSNQDQEIGPQDLAQKTLATTHTDLTIASKHSIYKD